MALSEEVHLARRSGFESLHGEGIEIGALHEPAWLPADARVTYVDRITRDEAIALFPEVDPKLVVTPAVIVDLDRDGLALAASESLDFVIACHVLEHLANPLGALEEIFRVLRPGGRAALAIPDKRFTFDRLRALTEFPHLWRDYLDRVTESSDDHYLDSLAATTDCINRLTPEERRDHVGRARLRREHAHVWDSASFRETCLVALPLMGRRVRLAYESPGDANRFEYFSVWEKLSGNARS